MNSENYYRQLLGGYYNNQSLIRGGQQNKYVYSTFSGGNPKYVYSTFTGGMEHTKHDILYNGGLTFQSQNNMNYSSLHQVRG